MLSLSLEEIYFKVSETQEWYSPKAIRKMRKFQYRLTQKDFSNLIGVCQKTYENWEQGVNKPPSAARRLLLIVRDHPEIFLKNREKIIRMCLQEKN